MAVTDFDTGPSALVTRGAFALARNPVFTAMVATSAGIAAMTPNLISLAATVVLVVSIQLQVRAVEEPYLAHTHGGAYAQYAARAGRFLPGIGRIKPARTNHMGKIKA